MKILIDGVQQRLSYDRLHLMASGTELDDAQYSGTWVEPVNFHLMLKPYRLNDDWYTSNSGNYAKTPLSGFSGAGSNYEEHEMPSAGAGPWITRKSGVTGTDTLVTTATFSKNRGVVLSLYNYGADATKSTIPIITIKWTSAIEIDVFSDGAVDVIRDGSIYKSGTISSSGEGTQTGKNSGTFIDLMVIPYNHNQLLIWSQAGGSFVVEFEDILPSDTSPTILPSGNVSLIITGAQPLKFQFAPILFPTSGTARSEKLNFVQAPKTGATLEEWSNPTWIGTQTYRVYGYEAYVGNQDCSVSIKKWDGTTFTPNGTQIEAKLQFALSTDNAGYTPTIVGGQIAYAGETAYTPDGEVDITQWVQNANLDVPETGGSRFTCKIVEVALAAAAVPNIRTQLFRPLQIVDDNDLPIFNGIITQLNHRREPLMETIEIEALDGFGVGDLYSFRERVPLSMEFFSSAVEFLVGKMGQITPSPVISSTLLQLPFRSAKEVSDWGPVIEVGDTATKQLQGLFETYAPDWVVGWRPTATGITFYAQAPDDLPTTGITVYGRIQDAVTAEVSQNRVWRNLRHEHIPAEANVVYVTGRNPRTDTLFQVWKSDDDARDPTVAIVDRPASWAGFDLLVGVIDPAITDEDSAEWACERIFARLSVPREIGEFSAKMIHNDDDIPLWKGDYITIDEIGNYRVVALSITWNDRDVDTIATVDYTLEWLSPIPPPEE